MEESAIDELIIRIQELTEQIENLKLSINASYDGLHMLDKNGNTILINEACGTNEGLFYECVKNKNVYQLIEEGYLSESVTLKVLEKKCTVSMIQKVKNGKDMLVTGTPIFDKNNEIEKVLVNSRDITELNALKKKLIESEMRFFATQMKLNEINVIDTLPTNVVGKSPSMKKIFRLALKVSEVDSNVLVTGESGTGKGIVSRFIHDKSCRSKGPFIKIDCSGLPETLFESEMFGYEKGAFTGANPAGKIGLIELANKGTLFLDEIGELSLNSQSKILRVIQDRELMRIGGKTLIKIDVRFITATNRNLAEMVENKTFREDLFYRLNVFPIQIPPLRERTEDIQELIIRYLEYLNNRYQRNKKVNLEAMEVLINYEWRGNVRELENLIERIFVTSNTDIIGLSDIPLPIRKHNIQIKPTDIEAESLKSMINEFEERVLKEYIEKGFSPAQISKRLILDVTTVRRKLHKYKIHFKDNK